MNILEHRLSDNATYTACCIKADALIDNAGIQILEQLVKIRIFM